MDKAVSLSGPDPICQMGKALCPSSLIETAHLVVPLVALLANTPYSALYSVIYPSSIMATKLFSVGEPLMVLLRYNYTPYRGDPGC